MNDSKPEDARKTHNTPLTTRIPEDRYIAITYITSGGSRATPTARVAIAPPQSPATSQGDSARRMHKNAAMEMATQSDSEYAILK
jgi:hypothetical protein